MLLCSISSILCFVFTVGLLCQYQYCWRGRVALPLIHRSNQIWICVPLRQPFVIDLLFLYFFTLLLMTPFFSIHRHRGFITLNLIVCVCVTAVDVCGGYQTDYRSSFASSSSITWVYQCL